MEKESTKIRQQPWYKERIYTKYMKALDKNEPSKMLIGKNWTFLKDGLDDFRDGLPPPIDGSVVLKPRKGPAPNIKDSNEALSSIKQSLGKNRYDKYEICYSKCSSLQQQRRDHIDEIEFGLMQHPLALYPHIEEGMPPDVFEDVVDILDPEMNLDEDDDDDDGKDGEDTYVDAFSSELPSTPLVAPSSPLVAPSSPLVASSTPLVAPSTSLLAPIEKQDESDNAQRNPFRWLPRKEEKERRDKNNEKRSISPSQDEHIKEITKEFCDWVASLGGESNNIEESTITSLFASGYETKPALSVPIHVVELTNVPPELRMSATGPQPQAIVKNIPTTEESKDERKQPVKCRYGAWYLPTKMWKPRQWNESLQDPQEIKDHEMSEAKKKSNALDAELAPMHGAMSFMDFISNRNVRRPEFLERVSEYQQRLAEEERLRLEAEAAKQKRRHRFVGTHQKPRAVKTPYLAI